MKTFYNIKSKIYNWDEIQSKLIEWRSENGNVVVIILDIMNYQLNLKNLFKKDIELLMLYRHNIAVQEHHLLKKQLSLLMKVEKKNLKKLTLMPEHNATLENVREARKILASLQPKIDKYKETQRLERERINRNTQRKKKLNKINDVEKG